ncbi:hypothetical protein VP01_9002g1, partial [Puccinia sorghi]
MQVTLRTLGNQYQEEVTQMVESGLMDPQIAQKIEETHKADRKKQSQPTSTEASPSKRFTMLLQQGIAQSLQRLQRKLNTMNLSRHTNDLESQKVDIETVLSCMIDIHQTPKGHNVGYHKMKKLLQKFGFLVHNMTVALINKTLDPVGVDN